MLLERLDPDRDLHALEAEEACTVIGTLLRTLDRPAAASFATLADDVGGWLDRLPSTPAPALPRRFLDQARALAADLLVGADAPGRLVHTDLHYANVLAGGPDRAPGEWVAIDPKPLAGDPAYGVWPALHNRWAEIARDARWGVQVRLGRVCEAAGLDEDRARAWAIVRTVRTALWVHREHPEADLTDWVTLLKALQPEG